MGHSSGTHNAFLSEGGALAVVVQDFHETAHQTRDITDFPRRLRKSEARLCLACPPRGKAEMLKTGPGLSCSSWPAPGEIALLDLARATDPLGQVARPLVHQDTPVIEKGGKLPLLRIGDTGLCACSRLAGLVLRAICDLRETWLKWYNGKSP